MVRVIKEFLFPSFWTHSVLSFAKPKTQHNKTFLATLKWRFYKCFVTVHAVALTTILVFLKADKFLLKWCRWALRSLCVKSALASNGVNYSEKKFCRICSRFYCSTSILPLGVVSSLWPSSSSLLLLHFN